MEVAQSRRASNGFRIVHLIPRVTSPISMHKSNERLPLLHKARVVGGFDKRIPSHPLRGFKERALPAAAAALPSRVGRIGWDPWDDESSACLKPETLLTRSSNYPSNGRLRFERISHKYATVNDVSHPLSIESKEFMVIRARLAT